jgi:putative membrane protein
MSTRDRLGEHVLASTVVLSAAALGLVVAAVRGAVPASALPRAPDAVLSAIPAANALIVAVAFVTVALGWRAIRRGEVGRHRALMATSTNLFALFLGLYLYRIVLEGTTAFGGPDAVYRFVYLPVLAVHMLLAMAAVPLVIYALLLAATRSVPAIRRSNHARVGRVAASLWLVSFVLGDVVFLLLYVIY